MVYVEKKIETKTVEPVTKVAEQVVNVEKKEV